MAIKPKAKSKADQYDSKLLPKPGKQTPADFMPKSYDTRFKPVKGGGTGNEYLKLGPREKTPGGGFSRNGSKLKKAKQGDSVAKRDTIRTEYNKDRDLSEVTKREGFGEQMKKFYNADMAKADSAKTKAGKVARKAVNTVTKVAFTPHRIVLNAANAAGNAIAAKKEAKSIKKNGGKVAPKMMMKKMSKKK
jgi:hypothetical protein